MAAFTDVHLVIMEARFVLLKTVLKELALVLGLSSP
jgi:hypothetical protein